MNALLPAVRELYSRQPEAFYLEPWELQHLLWSFTTRGRVVADGGV